MHGHHVHEAVLEAAKNEGLVETGCTIHFADEQYDTGSTILQLRCPVSSTDTVDPIANRVFELECEAYPRAIKSLIQRNASAG